MKGMQLVLISEHGEMKTLWLPQIVEGTFRFETNNRDYDFLYCKGEQGKWLVYCQASTFIHHSADKRYQAAELYDQCLLLIETKECRYILYAEECTEKGEVFRNYSLVNTNKITIGRESYHDICYPRKSVSGDHAMLIYQNEKWYIQDTDSVNGTFLNGKRVVQEEIVIGDVIYIMGLRMIIGTNFISINDRHRDIKVNTKTLRKMCDDDVNGAVEGYLYDEQEIFNRHPRKRLPLEDDAIVVEAPPMSMNSNKMPILLRMGGSMVMGGSAMLAGHMTTMLSSVLFPLLTHRYTDKEKKEYEERRNIKYSQYLIEKKEEIAKEKIKEEHILNYNYQETNAVLSYVLDGERLWERRKNDDDFMELRVGYGSIPLLAELQYPQKRFDIDEDHLEREMYDLVEKPVYLNSVPIMSSFIEDMVSGVIGAAEKKVDFAKQLILQTVFTHSYDEVKTIFLLESDDLRKIEFVRYIPHVWDEQKTIRFIATNDLEAYKIGEFLKKEFEETLAKPEELRKILKKRPYYFLFAFSKKIFESIEILKDILQEDQNCGISMITFFDDMPKECAKIYQLNELGDHSIISIKQIEKKDEFFKMDSLDEELAKKCIKKMSNTLIREGKKEFSLPKMITFLEMFSAGKIEHLNPIQRWQENNPVKSLATPVGVNTDGTTFYLDLHEKSQGPHGLVAGMTGSGKSEFIITYILSMAVNYHPDEVAFILIDYKGGGLAGAFEDERNGIKLPHLVGTITNLDGSAIQRSLISIQSELLRRQRVFNEVKSLVNEGTMDIYTYQKLYRNGKVSEPVPHLFIVSDEFAELKQQQPEFMEKLISAARIGRSLGVHLILATQKPSGVVNDQILSNTKFRVCLKVQDRNDSMEMLKRPEAAELKNTGSFYLQVGYNEYFALGQSAWTGADYEPSDTYQHKKDDAIQFIDATGISIQTVKPKTKKEITNKKQLVEVVRALAQLAEKTGYKHQSLWKPALSKKIDMQKMNQYYAELTENDLKIYLGMLDDPANQKQYPLELDLLRMKNMMIVGENGSGKTTFIQSMLLSLSRWYTPMEINYYIIDYSSRMSKLFSNLPHCGAVLTDENENKLVSFFEMIEKMVQERKQLFAEKEVDSFKQLYETRELPLILVVIDNFAGLCASKTGSDLQYKMQEYLKMGVNYGIQFVLASSHLNEMSSRVKQELGERITLQMKDRYDYGEALGIRCNYVPAQYPGRGLYNNEGEILEMQLVRYEVDCCESERLNKIKKELQSIKEANGDGVCAKKLPCIPEGETYQEFVHDIALGRLPLGYSLPDIKKISLPFKQFSMLSLYFGNAKSPMPVLSNILLTAYREEAEFVVVKRSNKSIFYEDSSVYASEEFKKNIQTYECNEEGIPAFWNAIAATVTERRGILEPYCKEQGWNYASPDIHEKTFYMMREKTKAKIVVFESFADVCNASDEAAVSVLGKSFKLARKYNIYFIGCFYPDDDSRVFVHPLMKQFNPDELVVLFGGQLQQQRLINLPMQYSKAMEQASYNQSLMKYNGNIYSLIMPCGMEEEKEIDKDDKNIFEGEVN